MMVQNPVLPGFHPDPCLCAAHGRYYLATSTFQWVPGVSLYESSDLAHWTCVGGALTGLDLRGIPDSAGVWAPDLTFDEASGRFWLTYTVAKQIDGIFKDVENYVVTAEDIRGPWSEPVFVNASGFDPGFYHEEGRHYVVNPQWDPRPLPGHHKFNGLVMQEFSLERGLVGPARRVLGNEDAVNWLREGPHVMRHDGWYYIACAEGGTGRRHRIRMARSRKLWGPYEVCPEPLVCAWCAEGELRKAGHGNFVQGPDGSWYVCFLCSRYLLRQDGAPHVFDEHEDGVSPLGRETALASVTWEDGWPRLATGGIVPPIEFEVAGVSGAGDAHAGEKPVAAAGRYETTFAPGTDLWAEEWLAPRRIAGGWWQLGEEGLTLTGGDSPSSLFDRSALARRVTSHAWHAECSLSVSPAHYNQTAGLICEYDARAFCYAHVGLDEESGERVVDVLTSDNGAFAMPAARMVVPEGAREVHLAIDVRNWDLTLSYAFEDASWQQVLDAKGEPLVLDAGTMSDERVAGWSYTGTMVGVTCVDMWDKTARAVFSRFAYEDVAAAGEVTR